MATERSSVKEKQGPKVSIPCAWGMLREKQLSLKETQTNKHVSSPARDRVTIRRRAKDLRFRTTSLEEGKKKQITQPPQDKLRASVVILCIKLANLNSADTDGKIIIITDMVLNVGRKRLFPARPWGIVSRRGGGPWKHKGDKKKYHWKWMALSFYI